MEVQRWAVVVIDNLVKLVRGPVVTATHIGPLVTGVDKIAKGAAFPEVRGVHQQMTLISGPCFRTRRAEHVAKSWRVLHGTERLKLLCHVAQDSRRTPRRAGGSNSFPKLTFSTRPQFGCQQST